MKSLVQSLLSAEPLDLTRAADQWAGVLPFLSHLRRTSTEGSSLLDRTERLMAALLRDPPEPTATGDVATMRPWWQAMPAAYLAAFCRYAGASARPGHRFSGIEAPHTLASRQVLRELGIPFEVRAHAVALLASLKRGERLVRTGAPAETYMRLSCALDTRALYHLRKAELLSQQQDDERLRRLNAFRQELKRLDCYGEPVAPPMGQAHVASVFEGSAEQHRASNAARYFRIVAGMSEEGWYEERLAQEARSPRGRLHLLIGPAACGKSTWARERLSETYIVSSDRMREELTGDPADQSQNYLVFQRCMDRIRQRLREGQEVTFDATSYSEALREMPVQAGRWCAAEIVGYIFDGSVAVALERNRKRERKVPEEIVRRHFRRLEPPALYEADRHFVVGTDGEMRQYWPT